MTFVMRVSKTAARMIQYPPMDKPKAIHSFKLKKSGLRTQVVIDINDYILYVSNSVPCGKYNDGQMFVHSRVDKKIGSYDCIMLDGVYYQFINQIIRLNKQDGGSINPEQFCCPIRKQKKYSVS